MRHPEDGAGRAGSPSGPAALTSVLAQEIAGSTTEIIGLNVLITDVEGTVIGSGDLARVGSFHEASVEVMRTLAPAAHDAQAARRLRGVRPGITLPIVLDGEAVGTVGITGSPGRVRRFGLVVKRQTEILLQESLLVRSRMLRERALDDLVRDIASFDADLDDVDVLTRRARELGYDVRLPRVAVLIDVAQGHASGLSRAASPAPPSPAARLRAVREAFPDPRDLVATFPGGRLGVLTSARPVPSDLVARCHRLAGALSERRQAGARLGVGSSADSVAGLRDSFLDAESALRLGAHVAGQARVHLIEDFRLYALLAAVGHRARDRYVGDLTAGLLDQPDWPTIRETVVAWCEGGFNLVRAATSLHVHRNTLIYRLDKISRLCGHEIREPRWALGLYVACLTDQLR